jgi:hypothetical protein
MSYQQPVLTMLESAFKAIQRPEPSKAKNTQEDDDLMHSMAIPAYEDWE